MQPVLYSVQSYLAYYLNTKYYNDFHFVWCAPTFDYRKDLNYKDILPPTSNPREIFDSFTQDLYRAVSDLHVSNYLPQIESNYVGLKNGADVKLSNGEIDKATYDTVISIINIAKDNIQTYDFYFKPLIYVIPYEINKSIITKVPPKKTALPTSEEYIIEKLPTANFGLMN